MSEDKKFLSNANDYLKSVLTYETATQGNGTILKLDKLDGNEPITLIDTRYWNKTIEIKDYSGGYTTIYSPDNLTTGIIELQLPDTVRNDVSGVIINGTGNRLLFSGDRSQISNSYKKVYENSFQINFDNGQGVYVVDNSDSALIYDLYLILRNRPHDDFYIYYNNESYYIYERSYGQNIKFALQDRSQQHGELYPELDGAFVYLVEKIEIAPITESELIYTFDNKSLILGEIENNSTIGNYALANGHNVIISGDYSHAEGWRSEASNLYAHAEGVDTIASGPSSHAEGSNTTASGTSSHAEGQNTQAIGDYCHTSGLGTIASGQYQTIIGQYNIDNSNTLFAIGNGTSNEYRSDAMTITMDTIYLNESVYIGNYPNIDQNTLFAIGNGTGNNNTSNLLTITNNSIDLNLNGPNNLILGLKNGSDYNSANTYFTIKGGLTNSNYSGINKLLSNITLKCGIGETYAGLFFRDDNYANIMNGDSNIGGSIAKEGWILNFDPCGGTLENGQPRGLVRFGSDRGNSNLVYRDVQIDGKLICKDSIKLDSISSFSSLPKGSIAYYYDSTVGDYFIFKFNNGITISLSYEGSISILQGE